MATPENIGTYVTIDDSGVEKYIITFAVTKTEADADVATYDPASPTSPGVTIARTWCRPLFDVIKTPQGG